MSMHRVSIVVIALGALAASRAAGLQDTVVVVERGERLDASNRVARQAVAFFNDRATTRVFGTFSLTSDEVISGDVAVYQGPVRVSGVIRGDIVVINGDLRLSRSADIRGDILVVGGSVTGLTRARVDGNARVYRSRVRLRRIGNRLELLGGSRIVTRSRPRRRRSGFTDADASIVVSSGGTYNRVEGLPVHVGPRLEWRSFGTTHLRIEALAILRTAGGIDSISDDIGYTAGVEWNVGGRSPVTLGARVYDVMAPVEEWQLRGDEIGLAAALWHRDYRDYYSRQGFAGFVVVEPMDRLIITGQIARNEDQSVVDRDPWTPFRGADVWRPNPAIDNGTFTTVTGRVEWDSRPYRDSPQSGWYFSGEYERGMSDDVALVPLPPSIRGPGPFGDPYTYDRVFVDVRRYERIGWRGQLSLRAVGAGTLGENDPLPVQRRLSLGGPDPMPGFAFRRFACNSGVLDPALPAWCDRILLFQAEYRGNLSFSGSRRRFGNRRRGSRRWDGFWDQFDFDEWFWFDGPTIVLFGNAGSAWLGDGGPGDFEGDVGAGLEFGSLGFYAAKAVSDGESVRVTLRLHRRF